MIIFKPGSHVVELFQLLAYVGEYPMKSVYLLGSERVWKQLIYRLTKSEEIYLPDTDERFRCRLLTIYGKGAMKSIRFYKAAMPILQRLSEDAYQYYLSNFNQHHFAGDDQSVERNHRVAETFVMFMKAGVEPRMNHQPDLADPEIHRCTTDTPYYYLSRLIKRCLPGEINKVMFSQMTGAVVRRDQYMMVYNCRKQALGWNGEGETKMLAFMGQVFNLFHLETYARRAPAILFGADYNVAWETLKLHGKFRKQDYRLDGVYETLYFVPLDDMGARLLKLRLLPNADECILDLLFYPEERQNNRLFHADLDGELCLSWLDGDLARLKRFRDYVKSRKGAATEERYRVICFEEQAAFLQAYMGKKVTIQTIPFGDFMNELNDTYQIDV